MAKKAVNKKTKKKNKNVAKQPEKNIDIQSMVLILLGVIFAVIIYPNSQPTKFSMFFKEFLLGGLMGKMVYALPILLIILGFYIIFKNYSKIKIKVFPFIILFVAIASLLTCYDYPFANNEEAGTLFSAIGEMANRGTNFANQPDAGGGLIGAIPAVLFIQAIGMLAAKTIFWGIIILMAFVITGVAFSSIVLGVRDFLANSIEKGKEGIAQFKQAREEERERLAQELEEEEEEIEEEEEDVEEEIDIPIISNEKQRRNNKFKKIMEQTEIVDSGKQMAISDLDLETDEEPQDIKVNPILENIDDEEPVEEEEEETVEEVPIKEPPKKIRVLKELHSSAPEPKKEDNKAEVLNLDHSQLETYDDYMFPPISLLNESEGVNDEYSVKELREVASKLQKTLTNFNVDARVVNVTRGPAVTQYEVQPNVGVKVSKILGLADDIALNLAAKTIRIEAPIPGKSAVGIEVPNKTKETVYLREVIESDAFQDAKSKVTFALGKSIDGEPYVSDIAKMPHLLIAGSTGSGKSVCINSILVSLLYKAKPNEVKLILIDPKIVELGNYNGIPHLLIPVVTDAKKAAGALNWAVQEMVNRYNMFAAKGVRDIRGYNDILTQEGEDGILPQIVIIVDELADLMMVAPSEVEDSICRLAQMARAAGMHLIIATQRPSVDVVTGIIKANIPSRIAFTVSSQVDSRTILDMGGAEKLLGKGDMLYYPMGEEKPIRVQGTFVTDKEIETIVDFVKDHYKVAYDPNIIEEFEKQNTPPQAVQEQQSDADELLTDAIELAVQMGNASASMIQRKFKVGYARAGRIIDQMEERGIVSGYDGSKPRQTLISKEEWEEMKEAGVDYVKYEEIDEDEYQELLAQSEENVEDETEEVEDYIEDESEYDESEEEEETSEDDEEYEEDDDEEEEEESEDEEEYEEDSDEDEAEDTEDDEDDEDKNNY